MDPRLLEYYNRELAHLREMGGEFAREFPKIAGRLGLETFECADPYVERLLEGFAFLAARVHLKIDAEFPRFTQHLLEMLHPHYLAPTPSMVVVQMQPSLSEGALARGYRVPRGSSVRSLLGKGEQTACEYRTAHDVVLWPVEINAAEYTGYLGDLADLRLPAGKTARAALRLKLRATGSFAFKDLALERLPIHLRGSDELPLRLYEQLMSNTIAVAIRPVGQPDAVELCTRAPIRAVGFEDDEALLPYGPRSFQGYRLLHEYFAFPQRFLFVELAGLGPAVKRTSGTELEVIVLLDRHDRSLENAVGPGQLALHCAPAVNLFPRRADRIHLTDGAPEYHLVPDRTRPMDFEVYGVDQVLGYGTATDPLQEFVPLYATKDRTAREERSAFYTVTRRARRPSTRQQSRGLRSTYMGSEIFLSLVDGAEGPYRTALKQLGVTVHCTNRDLPLQMPIGQGRTDFVLQVGAPVESIRCVAGPTRPLPSYAHGDVTWRLISHLSLNHLSLVDIDGQGAAALRDLLRLYADLTEPALNRVINGVVSARAAPITRRVPFDGPATYARGLEITLTCDEASFEGTGVYLLGAVLERFFAKYVSINSFTETALKTLQRGDIGRWPARIGTRGLL